MEASAQHWFKQVDGDLKTAQVLFQARRYQYAVFFCHLALEKFLKGCVAERTGATPPRSHDLVRLAELANLAPKLEHGAFLEELNRHALEARYPVGRVRFTRALAGDCLSRSEKALTWLQRNTKS